jgi:hypothetical protein
MLVIVAFAAARAFGAVARIIVAVAVGVVIQSAIAIS